MSLLLTSVAFAAGAGVPVEYTCDGANVSPPLSWSGVPSGTRSLALIVDDPDAPNPAAPQRTWVHWVLYNIPPDSTGLPKNQNARPLPPGAHAGLNDWKHAGYDGPCPPVGRHRYFYKLYALDTALSDLHQPDKQRLERAMEGHVIGHAELVGTYQH